MVVLAFFGGTECGESCSHSSSTTAGRLGVAAKSTFETVSLVVSRVAAGNLAEVVSVVTTAGLLLIGERERTRLLRMIVNLS